MDSPSLLQEGEIISYGTKIGRMGNTGSSKGAHVHTDIVQGYKKDVYHLKDIMNNITDLESVCRQFYYFLQDDFFNTPLFVTSHFGTIDYGKYRNGKVSEWKFHPAYDIVPENRHLTKANFDFYWNRSVNGVCLKSGFDRDYGNYVNIGFEV